MARFDRQSPSVSMDPEVARMRSRTAMLSRVKPVRKDVVELEMSDKQAKF